MHRRQQAQTFSAPETDESLERKRQVEQIDRAISLLKDHESVLPRIHEFANKPENQTRLLALLKVGWEKHEPAHRIAQIVAGATLLDFFNIDHQHLPKK